MVMRQCRGFSVVWEPLIDKRGPRNVKESEFLRELEEILEVDVGHLNPEVKLAALEEWNSLAVVSFIAMVDERIGLTLNARSIQDSTTVRDLMNLLGEAIVTS